MRILFVTAAYLPDAVGGVELHVAGLARSMKALGHECAVYTRTGRDDVSHLEVTQDVVDGIPVMRMGNTFEDVEALSSLYAHEGIADVFMEEVKRWKPDVVHVHHLTCLSTRIVDRLHEAGLPVAMTLHDFWMGCPRGQRITADLEVCPDVILERCLPCLQELWPHLLGPGARNGVVDERADQESLEEYHQTIRAVLEKVDLLMTPSHFMQEIYEAYGVAAGKIRVVENGLQKTRWPEALPTADEKGEDGEGSLRVGYIGSVLPSKGVHLLLEAYRSLGGPAEMRIDIWGEVLPFHNDRTYDERLLKLRQGHEEAVTFHGRYESEALPEILQNLDVVVVPSLWYEAFGLTIREAFLAGVPVVASGHGSIAEAIEEGVTGLLFPPGDALALGRCLLRLRDEPSLRVTLSGHRDQVRDESEAAQELLGLYDCVGQDDSTSDGNNASDSKRGDGAP